MSKFHLRLELTKYGGAISSELGRSWPGALGWYKKETGMKTFPHKSVRVYLCVSDVLGHLTTADEVLVLGDSK